MKEKIGCFTGHREIFEDAASVQARLRCQIEYLIVQGVTQFITGGARGFDTMAAQTVLSLKEKYPDTQLILIIPCEGQTRGWSVQEKEVYDQIRVRADRVTVLADHYYRGCMHVRNRHMVDPSSVCVCYLRKESGGTVYTVQYEKNKGIPIIEI